MSTPTAPLPPCTAGTYAVQQHDLQVGRARRSRRQDIALLVLATLVGLWLGLGAPDVSPVAPLAPVLAGVAVLPAVPATAPRDPPAQVPAPTTPRRSRGDGR